MNELKEKIILEIDSPKAVGGGLSALVDQLAAIDKYIGTINSRLAGLKVEPQFTRGFNELQQEIKRLQTKGSGLGSESLAKGLGFDPEQVKRFFAQAKRELKGFSSTTLEFASAPAAASAFNKFAAAQRSAAREATSGLKQMLTPTIGQVSLTAGEAKIEGMVPLSIPAAQVQASVAGVVQLVIPASQVQGGAGGGAGGPPRDPVTGAFLPGGGGGGGRKKKATKAALDNPEGDNEISRVRIETEKTLRETITEATELGETVSKTYDSVEGILSTVTRSSGGRALLTKLRSQKALYAEGFKAAKAGIGRGDYAGLAKLQASQAAALEGILTPEMKQALGAKKYDDVADRIAAQAKTLKAQSVANAKKGVEEQTRLDNQKQEVERKATLKKINTERARILENEKIAGIGTSKQYRAALKDYAAQDLGKLITPEAQKLLGPKHGIYDRLALDQKKLKRESSVLDAEHANDQRERQRKSDVTKATRDNLARKLSREKNAKWERIRAQKKEANRSPFEKALDAFTPAGFGLNLLKVTGWASAVTVLYKSLELVNYSLGRMMEIGAQTAQLGTVFRNIGGSAQELTDDLLQTAAATGRSTEEAMQSGLTWSRVFKSRAEISEGVRVSMVGANAANVDSAQSTQYLSDVTRIYNLRAGELEATMSGFINTSRQFKVGNGELMKGVSALAEQAHKAGLPLEELQALIASTASASRLPVASITSMLKTALASLNTGSTQDYLRETFHFEALGGEEGQIKNMSQVLRELYVVYRSLNDEERKNLAIRVAGRSGASRFQAMMDNYVSSQKAAASAQMDMNSAAEANARIQNNLKAQLGGVRAEFDRTVVQTFNDKRGGTSSINETLASGLRLGKNLIGAFNDAHGMDAIIEGIFPSVPGSNGITGLMNGVNRWFEGKTAGQLNGLSSREAEMKGLGGGLTTEAKLYRAVGISLGKRPDEDIEAVRGLVPGEAGKQIEQLVKEGNILEAKSRLNDEAAKAEEGAAAAKQEQLATDRESLRVLNDEIAKQQAVIESSEAGSAKNETATRAKTAAEEQRFEILKKIKEINDSSDGDFEGRTQRIVDILERQKAVTEELGKLYEQMPTGTAEQKLQTNVGALEEQKNQIDEALNNLSKQPVKDSEAILALEEQRRSVKGRIAAMNSPAQHELTGIEDARTLAFRRAGEQGQSYGVGVTEGEKLLERRRRLREEQHKERSTFNPTDNDIARQLALEVQLQQTKEAIQTRIIALRGQEKQIMIDANREFQKSLLFAGPGELLQKLTASKFSQGKLSAGQFFSMSPELRREIDALHGGEAGRLNRREQRSLRGEERDLNSQQRERSESGQRAGELSRELGRRARPPAVQPPVLSHFTAENNRAAASAGRLATAFADLTRKVATLTASIGQRQNPAPTFESSVREAQLGIQTGFALGTI